MKQLSLLLCLVFLLNVSHAQLENSNWCFSEFAGLTFNSFTPSPFISAIPKSELRNPKPMTSASVSNKNGNLLFYTNGVTIWDNINQPMPSGDLLYGDVTCTGVQNVVIVPKPGSETLYYIFTTSAGGGIIHPYNGIYYSIVDMTLNNGYGDIVPGFKNIPLKNHNGKLFNYNLVTQTGDILLHNTNVTTTLNCTKDKIWLTVFTFYNENSNYQHYAHEYLISDVGINNTPDGQSPMPTVNILLTHEPFPTGTCPPHFIKFSSDSKYLCNTNPEGVYLFDFDNTTGQLTMNRTISANNYTDKLGLEFSPNSQLVYYSTSDGNIYQNPFGKSAATTSGTYRKVDIWQYNINGSSSDTPIIVGSIKLTVNTDVDNSTPIPQQDIAANIQLAVNNKLYICTGTGLYGIGSNFLSSIDNPNQSGLGCTFIQNSVQLFPNMYNYGHLPQWVHKSGPSEPCGEGIWPKVYKSADGLLWLKQTTGNSLIALANIIDMPNNMNHVGDVSSSSQEILNWIHYGQYSAYTKWTNPTVSPYTWSTPFSLSNGQLQFCQYPLSPIYVDEQTGGLVSGPSYLPNNIGQLIAEDNGIYVAYEGNVIRSYSPIQTRQFNLPFSSNGIVKSYFNSTSKKLFFIFYSSGNTYLIVYNLLSNGFLIPQHSSYYDLTGYRILSANTADELFVLNSGGVLQEFDYINNTFTTLVIPNLNNQSLIAIGNDEQTVTDNILLKKENDYNIYAINTLSLTGKICYNSNMGSYSGYGVYSYFFDYTGQKIFVSGVFNTNNYTIATQTMPNISAGAYYGQSTFVTKLDLTSDFAALKPGLIDETITENYTQRNVAETNTNESKVGFIITQNPVREILGVNVSGFNKNTSPISGYITNAEGKKVLTMAVLKENNTVNVALLKPGIYYISLFSKEKRIATKLFLKE